MFTRHFLHCLALLTLLSPAVAAPPLWWSDGIPPVIDTNATANNHGPANIGQAKWMVSEALRALDATDPTIASQVRADLAGSPPDYTDRLIDLSVPPEDPKPDDWVKNQKAPLLIGQIKAISAPFYTRLAAANPTWLASERTTNGTNSPGSIFPWTASPDDDANKAIATIGQLKAVFSLRFETLPPADSDSDGLPDWWEMMIIAQSSDPSSMTLQNLRPGADFDGDGVSNLQEYQLGLSAYQIDSDGDGYSDRLSVDQTLRLRLDETTGPVAKDSSGQARNGSLISSASWLPNGGIEGGALQFHGGSDVVALPADTLNGATNLTISLWFKTSSTSTSQTLLSSAGATQSPELAISLENGCTVRFHTGSGQAVTWTFGRSLADGRWHQLTLTRNLAAGKVALNLDGAPLASAQSVSLDVLSVGAVALGQRHQSVSSYTSADAFTGLIDEVRIYSAVLDARFLGEFFQANDLDHDGLPDDYELSLFQNLTMLNGAADDLDGDGLTNRQEYERGTNPNEYYNGHTPVITLFSGSLQTVYNGHRTSAPLIFRVTDGVNPLVGAPVTLSQLELSGSLETLDGGTLATSLTLKTDSAGKVAVHFKAN